MKKPTKQKSKFTVDLQETVRPIYIVVASINYSLGELLKVQDKKSMGVWFDRLNVEAGRLRRDLIKLQKFQRG